MYKRPPKSAAFFFAFRLNDGVLDTIR
jgi:hypothetical protein